LKSEEQKKNLGATRFRRGQEVLGSVPSGLSHLSNTEAKTQKPTTTLSWHWQP